MNFFVGLWVLLLGMATLCSGCNTSTRNNELSDENYSDFLECFKRSNADINEFVQNDSAHYYHVGTSTTLTDSLHSLGSFELHVDLYDDSVIAKEEFVRWKHNLTPPSEINKAPKYKIRYSRYLYTIETGCVNEDNLDSLFQIFCGYLDTTKIVSSEIVRIKCGGEIFEGRYP